MTRVSFDWGVDGLRWLAPHCTVVVVVDVLSFSTASEIATSTGARVLPLPYRDERARHAAEYAGAVLAGPRSTNTWSLSPASLRDLRSDILLALPSPNGATLCSEAAASGAAVYAGCLRNATAVAQAAEKAAADGQVGVIAAGERWTRFDGPLRPAIEDLLGAGAIVSALSSSTDRSPEAAVAEAAYRSSADRVGDLLTDCVSGRELIEWGFPQDVALAAEVDVSENTPLIRDGVLESGR